MYWIHNIALMVGDDLEDVDEREQTNIPYGKTFSDHRATAEACVYNCGKLGRKTRRQKALLLVWLNHISLYFYSLFKSSLLHRSLSQQLCWNCLLSLCGNRSEIKCWHRRNVTHLSFNSSSSKPICLERDNGGWGH